MEASPADRPDLSSGRVLRAVAIQLVVGVLVLAACGFLTRTCTFPARVQSQAREIRESRPDLVMVGNSILRLGIDEQVLGERLGIQARKCTSDGSMSAFWYVFTKNVVARDPPACRALLIPFRDQHLTIPTLAVSQTSAFDIRALSMPEEPLLQRLAYEPVMGKVGAWAFQNWALVRVRDTARDVTERKFRNKLMAPLLGMDPKEATGAYFQVLSDERMQKDLLDQYQLRADTVVEPLSLDFPATVQTSFLPAMLEECQRAGVQLILVRMKRLLRARGVPEPEALTRYMQDLRSYVGERGALLLDYGVDPRIGPELFGFGDHLNEEGMRVFTELLATDLAEQWRREE